MLEAKPLSPFVHFVSFALCWPRRGSVSMFEKRHPVKNGRTNKSDLGQISQPFETCEAEWFRLRINIRTSSNVLFTTTISYTAGRAAYPECLLRDRCACSGTYAGDAHSSADSDQHTADAFLSKRFHSMGYIAGHYGPA